MVYIILALVAIALDQYTKFVARGALAGGKICDFIPRTVDFVYVENRGAAFGVMQDTRWFLIALTVVVLAVILIYVFKSKKKHPLFLLSVALVFAGGIGNLIDRVFFGYVTDFIHLLFIDFPCFNIADICVCTGGALLVIYLLFIDAKKGEKDGGENASDS